MQAFKKKDPYIKSSRFEIIKPTFNGLFMIYDIVNNKLFRCIPGNGILIEDLTHLFKLVFHIPEDKRCLRLDEAYLSFSVEIPNCYLLGKS